MHCLFVPIPEYPAMLATHIHLSMQDRLKRRATRRGLETFEFSWFMWSQWRVALFRIICGMSTETFSAPLFECFALHFFQRNLASKIGLCYSESLGGHAPLYSD